MAKALANQVRNALRNPRLAMVQPGDRLGVAVSGGADSVALLRLLLESREQLGVVLSIVHLNHKLRGKASDADEHFVATLAAKYGLEFHVAKVDVASIAKRQKLNLEDAARRERQRFFAELVQQDHVTCVAVAQTADDQAETVLAHILRGTGLAGLVGIHPISGPVIRPLLGVRREELRAYLRARKQTWREDRTNLDTARLRARIRRKLVPFLEKYFEPVVVDHLARLAELAREDEAFLGDLVDQRFATVVVRDGPVARLAINDILAPAHDAGSSENKLHRLSGRLVRKIVRELKPRSGQLTATHVRAILALAASSQGGKRLVLPGGLEVRRQGNVLIFRPHDTRANEARPGTNSFQYELPSDFTSTPLPVEELGCVFRFRVIDWPAKRGETNNTRSIADRDKLLSPVVLRSWRPGDKFRPMGHRNAHKLKELLNNIRVSRWEREGWPVLTSANAIVWARGLPVAAEFALTERSRSGLVIAEEPGL